MARVVAGKYFAVPPWLFEDEPEEDYVWELLTGAELALALDDGEWDEWRAAGIAPARPSVFWREYEFADLHADRWLKPRPITLRYAVREL